MNRLIASLALLLMFCLSIIAQQGQQYAHLVLPAPDGAPGPDTRASALNNSGQVFGIAGVINGGVISYVPVLWTNGEPAILPAPGSRYYFVGARDGLGYDFINDSGTVVSLAGMNIMDHPGDGRRPIIWQNGTPTILPLPSDQVCTQYAIVNQVGHIDQFGNFIPEVDRLNSRPIGLNGQNHVLVNACGAFWIMMPPWDNPTSQLLVQQGGPILSPTVTPYGNHLNDLDHALLDKFVPGAPIGSQPLFVPAIYTLGGVAPLPITARANQASDTINNNDQVLFFFQDPAAGGASHLELWDNTQVVDLGLNSGSPSLNNLGEVVFTTFLPSYSSRIYKDGVISPLNVPPPANGNISSTFLLNDVGQIAESTSFDQSQPYAVLFTPATVSVTVNTAQAGLGFTVDGVSYASSQTFSWTPGSNHTIATTSPQAGSTGTRYVFNSWSDGGAVSHTVSPSTPTTYTAGFTTQYLLTTDTNPSNAGTITSGGWVDYGTSLSITASSAAGFSFVGFSGNLTGMTNPQTLVMDAPKTVVANFKATTTTAVSSQPNLSTFGQSVSLTAVVSSASGTPTGNVTFFDDTTNLGTVALDATGQAILTTSNLMVGTHPITAAYNGDGNFISSSSTVTTQTVAPAPTTTALTSSVNPAIAGQVITFTATVISGTGTPGGIVTFKDGAATLGVGSLNLSGQASFATSSLGIGDHAITATYGGDNRFDGSTSATLIETVSQTSTTTVLQITPNPSVIGQTVNLVAVVTASSGGSPTGMVTFKEGGTTLATATLDATGTAIANISTLSLGTHNIKAIYAGTPNYAGSTSGAVKLTVNLNPTTTVLTSSQNPSVFGQTITFLVSVSSSNGGTPTGTVTIKDGNKTLGTATLNATGTASFTTSTLKRGTHAITAIYNGDSTFAGSTSNVINQTVN